MDTYQDLATNGAEPSALEPQPPAAAPQLDPSAPAPEPSPESPMSELEARGDAIEIVGPAIPAPSGWSDPQTGTDGPRLWDRLMISESARVRRYKRPATVVLVEVVGIGGLARLWGPRVAEHALAAAARILAKEIRTSDHIARLEQLRFGILLTETTEIAAINFVERARAACERDLHVATEAVNVAFGWASPPRSGDLTDAMELAAKRLGAELAELG
jgi:diguanylate cyclase (GGDEF)-like protein